MDAPMQDFKPPAPGQDNGTQAQNVPATIAPDSVQPWNTPSTATAASSPMSSAPPTPTLNTPMAPRLSHPATSPLLPQNSPRQPGNLRRTSSAMSLGSSQSQSQRSASTPKLARKTSRISLGGAAPAEEMERRLTPKRSISNLIAGLREAQSTMEPIEEPVPLTAGQIATDHFTRELLAHAEQGSQAKTVVIFHDACYGHRYSRLKATKTTLSMIVERPERILASALGASAAYVRLGEHHAGARNAPHPARKQISAPPFDIRRTKRAIDITSSYVTNVHGTAWMGELKGMCSTAGEKLAAGAKELTRAPTPSEPDKRQLHEGDLYLCPESLDAFQGALGGVADAVDAVFNPQTPTTRSFVALRPPGHHCSADYPSGFCWLNNVHVGIEYAAQTYGLTHAAILDFDLHHGDGSQAITWARNSHNNLKRLNAKPNSKVKLGPDVGYYSLHDINSYPCEMGDDEKVQAASLCVENAHGQSVWNVHLQPWKTEDEFWTLYQTRYRVLIEKARVFLSHHTARLRAEGKVQPRAAVFISAGFDASEWEGSGMQRHKVNVPTEFYARFTREVVQLAQEEGSGCQGRVVSVLEGGYSDRALCSGVLSHLSGLCGPNMNDATETAPTQANAEDTHALHQMLDGLRITNGTHPITNNTNNPLPYDKTWWSAPNLTALENAINPPPPLGPGNGKKLRTGPQPTYATPTESFAYKVVDPAKFARSISGTMREVSLPPRPPTPPPPEVDWVVATQELSKLLIPMDRQTRSCTVEELGGGRGKGARVSAVPPVTTAAAVEEMAGKPRQLRERGKGKVVPQYAESAHSDELESVRSVSRGSNRRQTVHALPSAATGESADGPSKILQRRASRRLSAGSALGSVDGQLDAEELRPPVPALPKLETQQQDGFRSMPAPPVSGEMLVKKTRAPAKAPALRKSGPSVNASASRAASGASSPAVTPTASMPGMPLANGAKPPLPGPVKEEPGLDALTSGMKRISLKVGSREEHERKQKEQEAAERRARALKGAETRRVNAAARKAAQAQQVQAQVAAPPQPSMAAEAVRLPVETEDPSLPPASTKAQEFPQQQQEGIREAHESAEAHAMPPEQTPLEEPPTQIARPAQTPPPAPVPQPTQTFEPIAQAQADVPTAPDTTTTTSPLIPNNNNVANGTAPAVNPSPTSTRSPTSNGSINRKLPTWSSTGPIPFAATAPLPPSPKQPRSPKNQTSFKSPSSPRSPWKHQRPELERDDGNGVSRTMLGSLLAGDGEVVDGVAVTTGERGEWKEGE